MSDPDDDAVNSIENANASDTGSPTTDDIDLAAIERDLTDVQNALDRLNDGSYWTDESTGEPIPDEVLISYPTARTAAPTLDSTTAS